MPDEDFDLRDVLVAQRKANDAALQRLLAGDRTDIDGDPLEQDDDDGDQDGGLSVDQGARGKAESGPRPEPDMNDWLRAEYHRRRA